MFIITHLPVYHAFIQDPPLFFHPASTCIPFIHPGSSFVLSSRIHLYAMLSSRIHLCLSSRIYLHSIED